MQSTVVEGNLSNVPFLDQTDRSVLEKRFAKELPTPVQLRVFSKNTGSVEVTGDPHAESGRKTVDLMKEIAELSENLSLEVINVLEQPDIAKKWNVSLTPAISISNNGDNGVRLLGFPARFEFQSFIETVFSIPLKDFGLHKKTLEKLKALDKQAEIKIFSTPG